MFCRLANIHFLSTLIINDNPILLENTLIALNENIVIIVVQPCPGGVE